ncbi:MAG: hypothetical protein RhofKO_12730 [Rhodothermales bacterium]
MKWGKISDDEWAIDSFEDDTSAAAIILTEYGNAYIERDWGVRFETHRRIKILRPEAYDNWGTVALTFYSKGQRITGVEGQTFTRDANGKVTRHKLGKKSIFKEKVSDEYRSIRFTLPNLEPGAIIEYRYTIDSESPAFLPDWTFQASEPTLWSEYRAEYPRTLAYAFGTRNISQFAVKTSEELTRERIDRNLVRYALESVPALREEPFMASRNNYLKSLDVQLMAYYQQGHGQVNFMGTWADMAEMLDESSELVGALGRSRTVKRMAGELTAGATTEQEKVEALHAYVRTTMDWDGSDGMFSERQLGKVLETKSGDGAEINLLLVDFLRGAGLTAHPILISTRAHGVAVEHYPILTQFNKMMAYVEYDGTYAVLDATDRYAPANLLPVRTLNGKGWVVDRASPRWVSLKANGTYQHAVEITATLDAEGGLSGVAVSSDASYSALFKRRRMDNMDSMEDFARDVLLDDMEGVVIDSVRVTHHDEVSETLETKVYFSMPSYAQAAGDFMYVPTYVMDRTAENPLKLADRSFPVDMAYKRSYTYRLNLTLPDGYALEEAPEDKRFAPKNRGGLFFRSIQAEENQLTVAGRLSFAKALYPPSEYASLREFYAEVVNTQAEPVVLKRISQP